MQNLRPMDGQTSFIRINQLHEQAQEVMKGREDDQDAQFRSVGRSKDGRIVAADPAPGVWGGFGIFGKTNPDFTDSASLLEELRQLQSAANNHNRQRGLRERNVIATDQQNISVIELLGAAKSLEDTAMYVHQECLQALGSILTGDEKADKYQSRVKKNLEKLKTPLEKASVAKDLIDALQEHSKNPEAKKCEQFLARMFGDILREEEKSALTLCQGISNSVGVDGIKLDEYADKIKELSDTLTQISFLDNRSRPFVEELRNYNESMRALRVILKSGVDEGLAILRPLKDALEKFQIPEQIGVSPIATPPLSPPPPVRAGREEQQRIQREADEAAERSGQNAVKGKQVIRLLNKLGAGVGGVVNKIEIGPDKFKARKVPRPKGSNAKPTNKQLLELAKEWHFMVQLNHPHILKPARPQISAPTVAVEEREIYFDQYGDDYISDQPGEDWDGNPIDPIDDGFVVVDEVHDREIAGLQMELTDGSLDQFLGRLSQEQKVQCCLDLLDAVSYMHSRKIAHMDMKPDNILYSHKDGIKVSDFGFSQNIEETGINQNSRFERYHAPPELGVSKVISGELYDSWSTALTILEIMTGVNLLIDDQQIDRHHRLMREKQPSLDFYPCDIPKEMLNGAVKYYLDKNQHVLGPMKDMLQEMLNISPHNRLTVSQAYVTYRDQIRAWNSQRGKY